MHCEICSFVKGKVLETDLTLLIFGLWDYFCGSKVLHGGRMAKIPKALPTINEKLIEAEESSVLQGHL